MGRDCTLPAWPRAEDTPVPVPLPGMPVLEWATLASCRQEATIAREGRQAMRRGSRFTLVLLVTCLVLGLVSTGQRFSGAGESLYTTLKEHAQRGGPEAAGFLIQALGKGGWEERHKIEALA